MSRILITTDGINPQPALQTPAMAEVVEIIDIYDLAQRRFSDHPAILLNLSCDQVALQRLGARLEAYLEDGGVIVFCGHVAHPFLPGLTRFVPMLDYRLGDLAVSLDTDHPMFRGVDNRDVTFRRGVAGFYGRGANPPPPGARIVATLGPARVPVDWQMPVGRGLLYVHAGLDLWNYSGMEDGTAARIPVQLIAWILDRANANGAATAEPGTTP